MITILDPNIGHSYLSFADFFDLNNPNEFVLYEDPEHSSPVDFLIQNHIAWHNDRCSKYKHKILLFVDTRHNYEDQIKSLVDKQHDRYLITNAIDYTVTDEPKILFNDYLFNRTKSYYLNYPFSAKTKWYFCYQSDYVIPTVYEASSKNKIFVAPNNIGHELIYRTKLKDFLKIKYMDYGYLGCPSDPTVGKLQPNTLLPAASGYRPPANRYYEDSFISIYGETIEYGTTFAATEKTFDPLIKGHFILPFSNYKFRDFITNHYGFKLPDFIDYSYDDIEDAATRYEKYQDEIQRLLLLSLDEWRQYWTENLWIIKHNQQIFFDRPYHRTDLTSLLK